MANRRHISLRHAAAYSSIGFFDIFHKTDSLIDFEMHMLHSTPVPVIFMLMSVAHCLPPGLRSLGFVLSDLPF